MHRFLLLFLRLSVFLCMTVCARVPRVTVVVVVDGLSYQKLAQVKPHLSGGIRMFLDFGLSYERAYYPHGVPETAPGHTSLSTGALPKDHGIIANHWYHNGKKISSDDDTVEYAEFAPRGVYPHGKSARAILVDGLSDQFVRLKPRSAAVAVSLKSRAAISMATHLGKAFWFDTHSGLFTSSRAYFDKLPDWVVAFNVKNRIPDLKTFTWNLLYKKMKAYAYRFINTTRYAGDYGITENPPSMAGSTISLDRAPETISEDDRGQFELFAKSPPSNKLLIKFACEAMDEYLDRKNVDQLLLWVSCSSFDKVSHPYGPDSKEAIDMLYHLDKDLQTLIDHTYKKVPKTDVLFVFTADHGLMPLPEPMHEAGYKNARRVLSLDLLKQMNLIVEKTYSIKNFLAFFKSNHFYVDAIIMEHLNQEKRNKILITLKKWLEIQPGIKRAWTFDELAQSSYHLTYAERESFYKYQLREGRSGELICQPEPYTLITEHAHGTTHDSPYSYDTHVPLIFYQTGTIEQERRYTHVWLQQVASTLAKHLEIDPPANAWPQTLPGQ